MIRIKHYFKNFSFAQKNILVLFLFAFLATVLIFSWFRNGHLYGGGDVGIPSYDPNRILNIARFVWWEASAPGTTVPHGLTSVPFQFFQATLQSMGLPYVAIQATFFWLILFLMGYGMYIVSLNVFGRERIGLSIISGLFYMFNPYMMIGVWHRFVHTTFFLAASLPFFFISWSSWIKKRSLISLFAFLLVNFLSVYLFGTLAFIVVILILLLWIGVSEILFPWTGFNNLKVISKRFIFGIFIWLLIHSWWLLPSFNIAPAIFSGQHSTGENLTTLLAISQQAIIPYSLLGINPFYIYQEADWGKIYNLTLFRILPLLSLIFLITGFFKSITNKKWLFWGLLLLLGLFLAKGAASPFGYTYIFGFSNIFALGVLRNPFEKLGILIPFSSAILFSLGINFYLDYIGAKFRNALKILIGLILLLIFGIFAWPMWTGNLFGKYEKSAFIELPQSYIEADRFIKNQLKDGNILHLPLTTGEAATYFWKYGYNGVESSQLIFNSLPSISRGFNIEHVDDALGALAQSFISFPADENRIINLMQAFNVRFIVLHKDMEWRGGYLYDPQKLEEILEKFEFLSPLKEFGDLVVYKLNDEFFAPKIRLSKNAQYFVSSEDSLYWPWLVIENTGDLLSPLDSNLTNKLIDLSKEIILMPQSSYFYLPYTASGENVINELPAVRILPNSPLYPLIILKEKILLLTIPQTDRFVYRVTLAGKRLVEAYKINKKNPLKSISSILDSYQTLLPSLKEGVIEREGGGLAGGEIPLESIFVRHLALLDQLYLKVDKNEKKFVVETHDKLTAMLKSSQLMPDYEIKEISSLPKSNRLIYKFEVPLSGNYEILQAHQNSQNVYSGELKNVDLQLDDQIKSFSGTLQDNFISYGATNFSKGPHEISLHSSLSSNLIKSDEIISLGDVRFLEGKYEVTSGEHSPSYMEAEIDPLTGGGWYQLSFESWIKLGDKFRVQLIQDSDPADPKGIEERLYSFNKTYSRDPYQNYWNKYVVSFHIRPATQKALVRFLVEPWDDCAIILVEKKLCQEKKVKFPFEHPSLTAFKNIELKRMLRNPLFLRTSLTNANISNTVDRDSVEFRHQSPVLYTGQLNIENPQFLIFSQTYHPGWKLKLNDGDKEYILSPTFIANRFANAYFLEKVGKYKFSLEFEPQNLTYKGVMISLLGFLSIIILSLWQKFKNRR